MLLFLEGADPTIPEYVANGPYEPVQIIVVVPATANTPFVPSVMLLRKSDNRVMKTKRRLVSMHGQRPLSLWLCLMKFSIPSCILKLLNKCGKPYVFNMKAPLKFKRLERLTWTYSNSEVLTKFLECLPECWDNYSICLKLTKDLNSLSLSTLYGILLNYKQSNLLKKNLIKYSKDSKSTPVALVSSKIIPSQRSTLTITELDSDSEDLSDTNISEFDESLALLTNSFKRFARKSNFRRNKPLSLTDKPKSTHVDKATAICFNGEKIGHFASERRSKKVFKPSTSRRSSDDKYHKLKEKYQKLKKLQAKSIEREQAIAALKAEKATFEGWCKSSTKITEIISAQISDSDRTGLGFWKPQDEPKEDSSMLKFGTFVSSIPDTSQAKCSSSSSSNPIPEEISKGSKSADKGKSILHPQKATKKAKLKVPSKPSTNQSSSSMIEIFDLCPLNILGVGPAHLKFSKPFTHGPKSTFKYRKCYHCGFTDHIASKCPTATKADKSAKVKMNASKAEKVTKAEKSTKVKNTTKVKKLTKVKVTTKVESSSAVKIVEPSISTNPKGPIKKWVPNKA
ncbi:hypothetical protein L6452_32916 [Arctium lappa]|uniref:Uncharacterized protein n=1 Tax=Arctium lappa TaxID=4217 RepID=A0ACB8Z657_ARCLA|nr:hypothetical protein L6452_32916 [Arctium lappa]